MLLRSSPPRPRRRRRPRAPPDGPATGPGDAAGPSSRLRSGPLSRPWVDDDLHRVGRDGLPDGGVHVAEAVAVRHELAYRVVLHVPHQLAHARAIRRRLFAADADDSHAIRAQIAVRDAPHPAQVTEDAGPGQ